MVDLVFQMIRLILVFILSHFLYKIWEFKESLERV